MKTALDDIRIAKSLLGDMRAWETPMQTTVIEKHLELRQNVLRILSEAENKLLHKTEVNQTGESMFEAWAGDNMLDI